MKLVFLLCMSFVLASAKTLPERCYRIASYGDCDEYHPMWAYSQFEMKCFRFDYSGCGGNNNRFNSQSECQRSCYEKSETTTTTVSTTTEKTTFPSEFYW
nr:kunitz-type serine protease inhibitor homolog delta-dendrotoxin-like [Drosophila kikkawai]